jgi:AGZA family xanthine/uracil permease-like MFS transporter
MLKNRGIETNPRALSGRGRTGDRQAGQGLLVLTGLLRFVLKMPDSLVFGRILPALGLMMCLSTMYYAFLAYRLALKTGRNDVCALPSGVSVPHMFIVTFVIMLPITTC